jgi:RNA recognition motif-containing protein
VCIKFRYSGRMLYVLLLTRGQVEYRQTNGGISTFQLSTAGMETRRVCISNLPPEVSDGFLRMILPRYGEVRGFQAGTCPRLYVRYPVANGI